MSVVEYEGFLASGALTLTPAIRYESTGLSLGAQGGWTRFESGNQIVQATATAAWLGAPHPRWRVELAGAAGASRYADEPGSVHALGSARLHGVATSRGAWAGASTGAVSNGSSTVPVEIEAGAWTVHDRFTIVGTVTGTWLDGNRHMDLLAAVRWTSPRLELESRLTARPWTNGGDAIGDAVAGTFGEVSALVALAPRVRLALSAGSYASDPVRRSLAARYITAGIRIAFPSPRDTPLPRLTGAALASIRGRLSSAATAAPTIDFASGGELRTIRVLATGARSVELMADFTDWEPVSLARVDGTSWEVQLPVAPGTHRLNIRIDGGAWIVPAGARPEPGEFGGEVGVVIVR